MCSVFPRDEAQSAKGWVTFVFCVAEWHSSDPHYHDHFIWPAWFTGVCFYIGGVCGACQNEKVIIRVWLCIPAAGAFRSQRSALLKPEEEGGGAQPDQVLSQEWEGFFDAQLSYGWSLVIKSYILWKVLLTCVVQWRPSKGSHIHGPGRGGCYVSHFSNRAEVNIKTNGAHFQGYLICTSNMQYCSVRVCKYHFQASCKLWRMS